MDPKFELFIVQVVSYLAGAALLAVLAVIFL